jgi:sulfur carrier protein
MMHLRINGKEADLAATTIAELLAEQGIDPKTRFLAVAVNGAVVRRTEWPMASLAAGDSVEIVRPFQGG